MKSTLSAKLRQPYFMAIVLGTALAALAPEERVAAAEITPHAINNISRYCSACWRNARLPQDQWNDCTQEVLCRLLKNIPGKSWPRVMTQETEERREFVRAIDAVKKRYQRGRWQSANVPELVVDARDEHAQARRDDREAVREASAKLLSERQQRILQLIGEGHNISDIAIELAISPERVSDEKYKAVQKLRNYFQVAA